MAVKYQISYKSYDETDWRIDLSTQAYTGDPIAVKGHGDNACIPEWDGGVDDPFDNPMVTLKLYIQFINEGQVDVEELQNAGDRDFVVDVYRNGAPKWKCYMVVDQIQRPLLDPPYVVRITAIDGLNMLDGLTYTHNNLITDSIGIANRSPLNFFRQALFATSNLGMMLPIRWHIGLEAVTTQDDALAGLMTWSPYGDGFVAGYYIDPTTGEQLPIYQNCRYIVEGLVKAFGARIFQDDGAWHIMRNTDIIDGTFTYKECDATLGLPTITQHTVDINRLVNRRGAAGGDYKYIREDALVTVKPALGKIDVRYDQDQRENIIPNGSFDQWSTVSVMYWGFTPSANVQASVLEFESLTGQPGRAVQISNNSGATEDAEFTFTGGLPLDANLLFKRMTWGFTIMPSQYGFPYDTNEIIDWSSNPLKVSVEYVLPTEGGTRSYFLNEFGYWQFEGRGLGLGVLFVNVETELITTNVYRHSIIFEGSPNIGDVIVVGIRPDPGDAHQEFSFTVTLAEEGDLQAALEALSANINMSHISAKTVIMDTPTRGRIRFQDVVTYGIPTGRTYKSGATQEYQYIFPQVENLAINDIANVVFQGKGGNNEILIPDPGRLDGQQDPAVGKMHIKFYVRPGQQYVLDEVWMRVDQNSDVYRADTQGQAGKSQEIVLGISSSFSGFMVSNLMRSYDLSGKDFIWTDGTTEASLTEHYARSVMRWRYKPSRIFNGTINTRGKDWKLLEIYSFDGLGEAKFLPLKARYNTERNEVDMVAMEGRDDTVTMDIKHYGSNNMPMSNYGGN